MKSTKFSSVVFQIVANVYPYTTPLKPGKNVLRTTGLDGKVGSYHQSNDAC